MNDRNQEFLNNCSGPVNIVTEDRLVFQGQIVRESKGNRKLFQPPQNSLLSNGFILLELRCEPAIIRDNAQLQAINPPLFEEGDIIRIRVTEIIAIGPGTGCIPEASD